MIYYTSGTGIYLNLKPTAHSLVIGIKNTSRKWALSFCLPVTKWYQILRKCVLFMFSWS